MNMSVLTAGRLLKSAVVFQTLTNLLTALPVRATIPIDYCQSFSQKLQAGRHPVLPLIVALAAAVDAAAALAVPVIIKTY
jgi:hypothetical protein